MATAQFPYIYFREFLTKNTQNSHQQNPLRRKPFNNNNRRTNFNNPRNNSNNQNIPFRNFFNYRERKFNQNRNNNTQMRIKDTLDETSTLKKQAPIQASDDDEDTREAGYTSLTTFKNDQLNTNKTNKDIGKVVNNKVFGYNKDNVLDNLTS